MARKPRINRAGFYHVINRGVEKEISIWMTKIDVAFWKLLMRVPGFLISVSTPIA